VPYDTSLENELLGWKVSSRDVAQYQLDREWSIGGQEVVLPCNMSEDEHCKANAEASIKPQRTETVVRLKGWVSA